MESQYVEGKKTLNDYETDREMVIVAVNPLILSLKLKGNDNWGEFGVPRNQSVVLPKGVEFAISDYDGHTLSYHIVKSDKE